MSGNQIVILTSCIYFIAMIAIGFYAARKNKEASDYLVAGRGLNLTMTALTLAAVQIGVGIVLSGATNGYNWGVWPGAYYSMGCGGGLILAGLLATKKLRKQEGYVPIDFFAQRYGDSRWLRLWAWFSNVPSMLGIFIAQMLACGSIIAGFGMSFNTGVIVCTGVVLIYCTVGGMWASVLTDVVQMAIILIGIPILAIATLIEFAAAGGSIASIFATPFIPPGMFTKFIYLVTPFLISIPVSYDAYMKIHSAKDSETATKGCIIGGIIVIIVGLLCSTIGAAAVDLFPGVTDGIFTIVTVGVLNPVLAGIVIAAILSAAMSSANAIIVSLGASFARDLYNKFFHPEVEELDSLPHSKKISQLAVFGGSLVGMLFAFQITSILDAMIIFNYPYMGSMIIPLLGGLLWKGATRKGAFAAAIIGGIIGVGAFLVGIPGPLHGIVNTDLALFIAYAISAIVLYVVSISDKEGQRQNIERGIV